MTYNDQNNRTELYIKRNREIINRIKGSKDDGEKIKWISLFVWANMKFFFNKSMRPVVVDRTEDETEVKDNGKGRKLFNHGSVARWLIGCDSAEKAMEIYILRSVSNQDDNSFYYLRKICFKHFQVLLDMDMEMIYEGKDYLIEICNVLRPLLLEESTVFKERCKENPDVISGRIKPASAIRMNKDKERVKTVSFNDTFERWLGRNDDEQYPNIRGGGINKDLLYEGIYRIRQDLKPLDEDDALERKRKNDELQRLIKDGIKRESGYGKYLHSDDEIVKKVIENIKEYNPEMYEIIMHYWEKNAKIDILNKTYAEFHAEYYREYKYLKPLALAEKMNLVKIPENADETEAKRVKKYYSNYICQVSRRAMLLINDKSKKIMELV